MLLDLFEGIVDTRTKLPFNPFAAAQTITVFTAESAFEFADELTGLFANMTHLFGAIASHIQDRAHMQCADGCMRIPSPLGAMACKNLCQGIGVFSQMHQRHGAVLDETHGFAIAF